MQMIEMTEHNNPEFDKTLERLRQDLAEESLEKAGPPKLVRLVWEDGRSIEYERRKADG